jgi:hypothetical protein
MRYVVYKGDDIKCMGTAQECVDHMGIKMNTFKHYLTPSYAHRVAERDLKPRIRKSKGYIIVEPMNDYIQKKLNG